MGGVQLSWMGDVECGGAQWGNGRWVPGYAASPDRACLGGGALGPSVVCSMPAWRPVGGGRARAPNRRPSPPTDLRGRHLPTTPRERSWTENQRRKSESVQTATAQAQNLH